MSGLPDSLMYLPKVTSCCDFKANGLSPEGELPLRTRGDWPAPKVNSRCASEVIGLSPEGELPLRIRGDWP